MKAKSSAHYQREFRKRLREQGLVKKEVWILPENAKLLSALEKKLRHQGVNSSQLLKESNMSETTLWSSGSLYDKLATTELVRSAAASIEIVDGVGSTLHVIMHEYGDLPLFVSVAGEQILVEALLWSTSEVKDAAAFNQAVLRTHKYFPLSTISLDELLDGDSYYQMFGALSSASSLDDILLEIEVLATNVINATEAFSDYLVSDEKTSA